MRSSAAHRLPSRRDRHATTRALACLAAALAVVNAVFLLWPGTDRAPARLAERPDPAEEVVLQFAESTRQPAPAAPAPPPAMSPLPPVEVPDERPPEEAPPEEIVVDLPLRLPSATPAPTPAPPAPAPPVGPRTAPPPAGPRLVERPERSPRLVRAALPVYPPDARRERIRAEARVRVLVDEKGEVLDAEITERTVFDGGREAVVAVLPFGLEAAALDAARRHRFQAARDGGERVRSWTTISLTFDPPR